MTQNATPIRLHMGCGESLRSQMLLIVPRQRGSRREERRPSDLRLPAGCLGRNGGRVR